MPESQLTCRQAERFDYGNDMLYLVALGSNRPHGRFGPPGRVIDAAISLLGSSVIARSKLFETAPIGPSNRRYANAAMILKSQLPPPDLLKSLKKIERSFGRRSGMRWGARVLDLDIILWSGGLWASRELAIPHPAFRRRSFVLDPAVSIASDWKDPVSGLRLTHLKARLDRKRPCA
jgi:2-amino-4-hydroxy-6-hydroxymethyldihydropteridine diphosphokinase